MFHFFDLPMMENSHALIAYLFFYNPSNIFLARDWSKHVTYLDQLRAEKKYGAISWLACVAVVSFPRAQR